MKDTSQASPSNSQDVVVDEHATANGKMQSGEEEPEEGGESAHIPRMQRQCNYLLHESLIDIHDSYLLFEHRPPSQTK